MINHPKTPCAFVQSINTYAQLDADGSLIIDYILSADLSELIIPTIELPSCVDGLWEHTCFEAFICVKGEKIYYEYNFSPSTQWAAYAFSDYRQHKEWSPKKPPSIAVEQHTNQLLIKISLDKYDLPKNPSNKPLQLGLTAVLEAADGSKSYWALNHPDETPDFHNKKGFIREIWP